MFSRINRLLSGRGLVPFLLAALVLLTPLACNKGGAAASYPHFGRERDPRNQPYVIGVGDRLRINVWKDPELSTEAFVRPDGTVTMPLIGDIRAKGRTPADLTKEIKQRLDRFVKDPLITVAVTEVNSYQFTVTGNVAQPGVFTSRSWVSVSEAISLAGGPNRYADANDVVIIRRDSPEAAPRRIPIDYEAILDGEAPRQDIVILPGDTIYVP
jgi:polysaccharide biosynthesis/export protein